MTLCEVENIKLDEKYYTKILRSVKIDDISEMFGTERVIYVVLNMFTDILLNKRDVDFEGNSAVEKKKEIASRIPYLTKIVSIGYTKTKKNTYSSAFKEDNIQHLPTLNVNKVIDRLFQLYNLSKFLIEERENYDTILFYNFLYYVSLPPLLIHFIFNKKIAVDFEDNYERYSLIREWVSKFVHSAILVNEQQEELLRNKLTKISVVNTFANLEYVETVIDTSFESLNIIYTGKIDRIRGADLIPNLSYCLTKKNIDHKIQITGYGDYNEIIGEHPLYEKVKDDIEFLGFVEKSKLEKLLSNADLALSLDKPDAKQNRYLYPSKVQLYSKHNIPVLTLE